MPKKKSLAKLKATFNAAEDAHSLTHQYQVLRTDDPIDFSLIFRPLAVEVTTSVYLGTKTLLEDDDKSIIHQPIGSGNNIRGKTLKIYSTLTRTDAMGNAKTFRLDFAITGGIEDYQHSLEQSIPEGTSTIDFEIIIPFFTKSGQ